MALIENSDELRAPSAVGVEDLGWPFHAYITYVYDLSIGGLATPFGRNPVIPLLAGNGPKLVTP
jgi:hypothetical protein